MLPGLIEGMDVRLDFFSLRLFVDIVELRSIAKGAQKNFIAVSAASRRVSELERTFGTQLLHRQSRGVEATHAGSFLFEKLKDTLKELQQLSVRMKEYGQGVRGSVRLYSDLTAMTHFLSSDLADFSQAYPEIRLELEEHSAMAALEAVAQGVADIGIIASEQPRTLAEMEYWPYYIANYGVLVPQDHVLANKPLVTLAETLQFGLVGLDSGDDWDRTLERMAANSGHRPDVRVRVKGFDGVCRMVGSGLGIAIVPAATAEPYAQVLGLKLLDLDESWAKMSFYLCARKSSAMSMPARLLLEQLRARGQ